MRTRHLALAISIGAVVGMLGSPAPVRAADPDWKAVEQALGTSGQLQDGDVFRVGMPRTDLSVRVKGLPVKAGFALGSYAAFKQLGAQAMVMGDLVLLDQEVPAVMSGLFSGGLEVTAVHNHVNEVSPHVMYMHYEGHGDARQLARALRQALSASATPLGVPGMPAAGDASTIDTKEIERAVGRPGRDLGAGVFQVTVPRAEAITENALEDNFRLYAYDRGRRQLATARVKGPALGRWHTVRVVAVGDHIQAWLDGTLQLDHRDSRFASGRVGLWRKADSITAFDDLKIRGQTRGRGDAQAHGSTGG